MELTAIIIQERVGFTATCPELGLEVSSKTQEAVLKKLKGACKNYLEIHKTSPRTVTVLRFKTE